MNNIPSAITRFIYFNISSFLFGFIVGALVFAWIVL